MRDSHASVELPVRRAVAGRALPRPSRAERLGEWIECVLDFGDALDGAEVQLVLDKEGGRATAPMLVAQA